MFVVGRPAAGAVVFFGDKNFTAMTAPGITAGRTV